MSKLAARIKVILTALPTYLTTLSTILGIVIYEVGQNIDGDAGEWIVKVAGVALTIITAAIGIIRKVTPVAPNQVGILPQGPPSSPVVIIDQTPPRDVPGGQNDAPGGT
jgi:hypothetical protein